MHDPPPQNFGFRISDFGFADRLWRFLTTAEDRQYGGFEESVRLASLAQDKPEGACPRWSGNRQ